MLGAGGGAYSAATAFFVFYDGDAVFDLDGIEGAGLCAGTEADTAVGTFTGSVSEAEDGDAVLKAFIIILLICITPSM